VGLAIEVDWEFISWNAPRSAGLEGVVIVVDTRASYLYSVLLFVQKKMRAANKNVRKLNLAPCRSHVAECGSPSPPFKDSTAQPAQGCIHRFDRALSSPSIHPIQPCRRSRQQRVPSGMSMQCPVPRRRHLPALSLLGGCRSLQAPTVRGEGGPMVQVGQRKSQSLKHREVVAILGPRTTRQRIDERSVEGAGAERERLTSGCVSRAVGHEREQERELREVLTRRGQRQ